MSLIKASEAASLLRPLAANGGAQSPAAAAVSDPALLMEAKIAGLEDELALLKDGLPAKLEAARKEGLEAGRKERDDKAAERLSLLGEAARQALSLWEEKLASAGQLAIFIAKGALARLIGNPDWRSELIVGSIERRIAALGRSAIVRVEVSGADFSEAEIAALAITSGTRIEAGPKLRGGECRVELEMGHEDLGVDAQWGRLALLLDELAEAAC